MHDIQWFYLKVTYKAVCVHCGGRATAVLNVGDNMAKWHQLSIWSHFTH